MSHSRDNRTKHADRSRRNRSEFAEEGFKCVQCGLYVSCTSVLAGVQNRNHCPYCLWSRHLDSLSAGDRRSGCRGAMQPVALTTKKSKNKYAKERDGELMLVHRCSICSKIVINRIAADDSTSELLALFRASWAVADSLGTQLEAMDVSMLTEADGDLVHRRLFGTQAPQVPSAISDDVSKS